MIHKAKSKISSPANIDSIERTIQNIQLSSERKPNIPIPLSKTVRRVCLPGALLRILKDIEEQAVFENIIHNTKEWKTPIVKNRGADVDQK